MNSLEIMEALNKMLDKTRYIKLRYYVVNSEQQLLTK